MHAWKQHAGGDYAEVRQQSPGIMAHRGKMEGPGGGAGALTSVPVKPFAFDPRRVRIDWRLLHSVDLDRLVRGGRHALNLTLNAFSRGEETK
jgi:hypothetical protein